MCTIRPGALLTARLFIIFNFPANSFHPHTNFNNMTTINVCTWHDSSAVVPCAKICSGSMTITIITSKLILCSIWVLHEKLLVRWPPGGPCIYSKHCSQWCTYGASGENLWTGMMADFSKLMMQRMSRYIVTGLIYIDIYNLYHIWVTCILARWIYHIYHIMLSSKQISFLERICQLVKYIWCKSNDTWTVRCIETHWIYKREFFPMWLLFLQWTDNWYPFETLQWSWCWENQAVNSMLQMTYITIINNKCNAYLLWNRK